MTKEIKYSPSNFSFYSIPREKNGIRFRNYQKGDENGLADVFNRGFQQNGGGFLKTPKIFHWRYVEYPDFKPEIINLAEDIESGKIVGSVMGNLTYYNYGNKKYKFGVINDVATVPGYGGRGIAKTLIEMALNYFRKNNADFACLSADPNGFPRSRIYIPHGFYDYIKMKSLIFFPDIANFIKNLPAIAPAFPAIIFQRFPLMVHTLKSYYKTSSKNFPNLNETSNSKIRPLLSGFKAEISLYNCRESFRKAMNESGKLNYIGYHEYSREEFNWCNNKTPLKLYRTSEVRIENNNGDIIGGALIFNKNFYAVKFGIKVRMAIVKNIFLNERYILSQEIINSLNFHDRTNLLSSLYALLLKKIVEAATKRNSSVLLMMVPENYHNLINSAKLNGFFSGPGGVHMVKEMKPDLKHPKIDEFSMKLAQIDNNDIKNSKINPQYPRKKDTNYTKPFYLDPGEDFGAM